MAEPRRSGMLDEVEGGSNAASGERLSRIKTKMEPIHLRLYLRRYLGDWDRIARKLQSRLANDDKHRKHV